MCGICGIIGVNREAAAERVKAMCRDLAHRGPDDEHIVTGRNWALGQRRLSVIDLSRNARQPFVNEDGSRFLTSNGEIYNYRELRPALVNAGHRFVSASDCEVILHLLEEEGAGGILKLNGMYAFAYLDEKRRKVLLCRDRLGIKPLYYRRTQDAVLFASEIKALAETPASWRSDQLQEFFQYRYLSGKNTLFMDVQEVLPGHLVTIDLDTLAMEDREYWVPAKRVSGGRRVDERALGREIEQAVARQLVSDVPVGCQLSGGLDSSLVTQMAMSQMTQRMHTFSMGFDGHAEDESSWALLMASQLGTIHHAIQYKASDFLADLAACTWLNDEPLNHPNSVAMFKLCREAKPHVTVLMTGEGADELFGGYTWHKRLWRLRRLGRLAQWPVTRRVVSLLPRERWAPILPLLGISPAEMALRAGRWVSPELLQGILCNEVMGDGEGYRRSLDVSADDCVAASLDLDLRTYLVSVLQRQDRMSMASGVESRVPFLDHELVDFALRIPLEQLFEGKRGKAILRHVAAGRIPDAIINRPKVGFSIPLAAWMRQGHELGHLLGWLTDERAADRHIWKVDRVRQLVADHQAGKADCSNILWSLLSFEVWARVWLDGTPHEKLKDEILLQTSGAGDGCRSSVIGHKTEDKLVAGTRTNNQEPITKNHSPLRVCHIVTSLHMGGMERMVCDLIGGLQARGVESVVCCTDDKGELYDGAPALAKFCGHRKPGLLVIDWKLAFQIYRFVRDNQVTVIHAHNHAPHLYAALLSFFTGIRVIATRHGQGYRDKPRVRFLKRFLAGKSSMLVLVSEDAERVSLANRSLSASDSIVVIPNGVNTDVFRPRSATGTSYIQEEDITGVTAPNAGGALRAATSHSMVIGSVGRLSPEKNYPLLIRAFARLVHGYQSSVIGDGTSGESPSENLPFLILVGDGPDRGRIEEEIARCNVKDRCYITGMQSQVLHWLHLMDIFCLSSDTEGLSISLLEAGACGLPSVVTDAGGNREIVRDGVSGLVVPMRDEAALAAGFDRLVRDAALRHAMGAEARRIVEERFSLAAMVDGYVKAYAKVLQ